MKLYTHEQAPNPRRVHIFLREKQIKVETVQVDFMKGELKGEEFTKKNPAQRIPVLELDGGTCISETVAICRYFEEMYPLRPLFGLTAVERATVEMWNRRTELNFLMPVFHVFRHGHPAMAELEKPQIEEWSKANRPKAIEGLAMINDQLEKKQFVAGDRFSIADISAYVGVKFCRPAKVDIPEGLDGLQRWLKVMEERPSIAAKATSPA
ncbi:glutathione S-transferase [Rhodobacteraceae bacterium RKSG542]|uniref:glutathione S-transferase family protein n=1 Tax=Pseudovibrio flavus TaxID=2529854 RepID=UPI0012BC6FA5|nr:glutathione S-transferase [Pseudovibrio flavus]MTI16984.1 glutathione S-transferase [Pseudovibrio flavus]